ncbi:hypothetical protein BC830DRAFT_1171672 [Chytriomyces sp. MP71]|nr:hypothetical protein BC830DRAFT_1171672 [Chytriomyces sp. MP71]
MMMRPVAFASTRDAAADALRTTSEAVSRFGIDGIGISFNGGKDCTVMLHILHNVLESFAQQPSLASPSPICNADFSANIPASVSSATSCRSFDPSTAKPELPKIPCLYVTVADQFPEVDCFVDEMAHRYNLNVFRTSLSMKEGLAAYLAAFPQVKAVLVGTRRTDPYSSNLKPFDPTDNGWPDCVRVHPILDWSYNQVWEFLTGYKVPYCSLYDEGYTSLGGIHNTLPNPALRRPDGGFDPAWRLRDGGLERSGRLKRAGTGVQTGQPGGVQEKAVNQVHAQ